MKLISILFALILMLPGSLGAQGFTDKTNVIRLNFKQPMASTTLPDIRWIMPAAEVTNSIDASISISVRISSDIPLKEVRLEVLAGGETRVKQITLDANARAKNIEQPIVLVEGENSIKLVVENEKGGSVSSTRVILSGKNSIADAVDINRKDYALLFVTDNYDNWIDLVNPIHDGRTLADLLKDKFGFQTEVVENPTIEEIQSKIYDYNTKKFNPQDQLFVFFAGHGAYDETLGEGYIVGSNSLLNDKGRTTYIPHILIRQRLDNIKCDHIFLAMDVCFGGTFDPILARSRAQEDATIDSQYLVKKLTRRTRKFLTSGSKEYVSDGTPGKHSPFAEKFILALREMGDGSDRIVSLLELYPYFLKLTSEPRSGSFGSDDPASDFVFIAK